MIQYLQKCNLENLTQVNNWTWVSRCPVCGDSKKSKSKKRFYILLNKNIVYCHNCGLSSSIEYFLKTYYYEIYKEYISDKFSKNIKETKIDFSIKDENRIELSKVIEIGNKYGLKQNVLNEKFVKDYLIKRNIIKYYNKFWYIDNFIGFKNELYNDEKIFDTFDPRLIIPFFKGKEIYALQGRTLLNKIPKYVTLLLDKTCNKLYNYYNVNINENVYLLEGVLDSLILPNSIALAGSKLSKELLNSLKKMKIIVVLDNDFVYNIDIRKSLKVFIDEGFKVFIPPKNLLKFKDLNEMTSQYNDIEIKKIIDNNVFSGIMAKTKLSQYVIKGI